MSDLIRREDAIATIGVMYERCDTCDITDYRDLMLEAVKVLPTAEITQKEVLDYCRPRLLTLVAKEAVPLAGIDLGEYSDKLWRNAYERGKADRPQGEWFKDENGDYRCSECGGCEEQFIYGTENWYGRGESKFCPSCGARMKGVGDEG